MINAADMEKYFEQVCRLLSTCRGGIRAMTIDKIRTELGVDRRLVEELLETRLADFPFVLVSGSAGYFIPVNAEDINDYYASLGSRMIKLHVRRKRVRNKAIAKGWSFDGRKFTHQQGELFDL